MPREGTLSESEVRADLAAAFRWAARLGYHESTANHFSAAVSPGGKQFLINPIGRHFSKIRASELLLLNIHDSAERKNPAIDSTALHLHAHLHRMLPNARCVLHTHMPYATTLACLKDFEFLMLDQNACRFYGRIAYDRNYSGMALDDAEGERIAKLLDAEKRVLFLGNHGVIVVGRTVAEAFDELYYLERAAQLQVLALSTHRPLKIISDATAAVACKQWLGYPGFARLHLTALRDILDSEDSDYAR